MYKARKITSASFGINERWQYRGGFIEHLPKAFGRRSNWHWGVCGAGGWSNTKAQAKKEIDRLLDRAKQILDSESAVDDESVQHSVNLTKAEARVVLAALERRVKELDGLGGPQAEALSAETRQVYQLIDGAVFSAC